MNYVESARTIDLEQPWRTALPFVYLAHPIDNQTSPATILTLKVQQALNQLGINYYDPGEAWQMADPWPDSLLINQVNRVALSNAYTVLAIVVGPTIGVPSELTLAVEWGIPTVVISDLRSVALNGLATHGLHATDGYGDAIKTVRDLATTASVGPGGALISRDRDLSDLPLPIQAKPLDVGLDLYTSNDLEIPSHDWRGIPSRVRVMPPRGLFFMIMGRSSSLHRRGLIVVPSVIDPGFRGDLFAMAYNFTDNKVNIERGDRIAQLVPLPAAQVSFQEVDILPPSVRGATGFGSTGS